MKPILQFLTVLVFLSSVCICEEVVSKRTKRSNWDAFLLAHTLDPADPRNTNYQYWTSTDWDYWLRLREKLHDVANCYRGTPLASKGYNTVIIGTPKGVERAFTGRLIPYRYDGLYWSNRSFQTYVLRRNGRYLDVYDCGHMYFVARLDRLGLPIQLHTAFPEEYYYPFKGDLHYNLYRHCYRASYNSYNSHRPPIDYNPRRYITNFYTYDSKK